MINGELPDLGSEWMKAGILRKLFLRLTHTLKGDRIGGYRYDLMRIRPLKVRQRSITTSHNHLSHEAIIMLEGRMNLTSSTLNTCMEAGTITWIPAGFTHSTERLEDDCSMVAISFVIDPPLVPTPPCQIVSDAMLYTDILALCREAFDLHPRWEQRAQLRLTLFLSGLLASFGEASVLFDERESDQSIAIQIEEYLRPRLAAALTLPQIASALNMSVRSLVRHFHAETGETVMGYLRRLRIETALNYLEQRPDLPMKQLAAMVGFTDASYFSRSFRRMRGMNPRTQLKLMVSDIFNQ